MSMTHQHVRVGSESIAVHVRGGSGHPIVLVHGNSCSSRAFAKQLESRLAERFRLVAINLPGHGESPPSPVPEKAYTVHGYAALIAAAARELGVEDAVFVGWSLGGHALIEASDRLGNAAGLLVFGTPPLSHQNDMSRAFSGNPAIGAAFRADSTEEEILAVIRLFFRPGFACQARSWRTSVGPTSARGRRSLRASPPTSCATR